MSSLLTPLFARFRGMSWGQRGYALIVMASIVVFSLGGANYWRARNYERMSQRIAASGARSTQSFNLMANEEDAYFLALLGDFSGLAVTGVIGNGPDCTVDAALLHDLRGFAEVHRLQLVHTPLKHEEFKFIYDLENLRWLSLAFSQLTDADLAGVETMQSLDTLDVQFTALTDESIPRLAKLTTLSKIDISGTDITAAGAERLRWEFRLAQGTQAPTTVVYRPAPTRRFREAVTRLLPTRSYGFDTRNPAGGLRLLLRPENWKGYEKDIPWIAELADLESVTIQGMPVSAEMLEAIAKLPNLRQLNVFDTPLVEVDFSKLAGSHSLRSLRLSGILVEQNSLDTLATLNSLESLSLVNCRLTPQTCAALGKIRNVQSLQLQQLIVNRSDFSRLLLDLESAPQLRLLEITQAPLDNETIHGLARLKQLVSLSLASPKIDDAAVPELSTFNHLKQLDISGTRISVPKRANSNDGASQLETALLSANVRVVHRRSKTSPTPLKLDELTATVSQKPAPAAPPAATGPTASSSQSTNRPSR